MYAIACICVSMAMSDRTVGLVFGTGGAAFPPCPAVELDGAAASLAEVLRRDRAVDDETLRRSLLRAMASRRLHGEVLVRDFKLSPSLVDTALRRQLLTRLAVLEQLGDAQVFFRV